MVFVTVNCPPRTAGGLVTSSYVEGGVRLGVDCNVNLGAVMINPPLCASFTLGAEGAVPRCRRFVAANVRPGPR